MPEQPKAQLKQVPPAPVYTAKRALAKDITGVQTALLITGHQIRRNTLAQRVEALYDPAKDQTLTAGLHDPWPIAPVDPLGHRWEEWSDRHDARIRAAVQLCCTDDTKAAQPWRVPSDLWATLITALAEPRAVHPVLEWLETLTPVDHPGLIPNLLPETLGSPLSPLTTWAAMTMLAGPVRLAEWPLAMPPHEHAVLTGIEGTGKSSLIRGLMPHHEWHDEIELEADQQRMAEACLGSVLVEWAEMVGAEKVGNAKVRSFLTRPSIKVRLAWGRHPVRVRIPIIVGTTNKDLPKDLAGHRRFVAIEAPGRMEPQDLRQYVDHHRIHLFETVKYHRLLHNEECSKGECIDPELHSMLTGHLPTSLKDAQRRANEGHTAPDIITDTLEELAEERPRPLPIAEVVETINRRLPDGESVRANSLGKYLRAGGWIQIRARRGAPRCWTPPTAQLLDDPDPIPPDAEF